MLRPARFRRTRILIIGCGDVGQRLARLVTPHSRVLALTSSPERQVSLRAQGLVPLLGNLDDPRTLGRLAGLAQRVVHLAPPPSTGDRDPRTVNLLRALARRGQVRALVYGSTTGVYGDAQGQWVDEASALAPQTDRARRRVAAEQAVRQWGSGARGCVLRIPGIYALDREGGDPRDRVRRGAPVLQAADDVYTNHIHADDLARACLAALWRGRPGRVVQVCDDQTLPMGDYFDLVADLAGLDHPPRLSRAEARQQLSPMQMSFLSESRRLRNQRLKTELRLQLRYPTVREAFAAQV